MKLIVKCTILITVRGGLLAGGGRLFKMNVSQ